MRENTDTVFSKCPVELQKKNVDAKFNLACRVVSQHAEAPLTQHGTAVPCRAVPCRASCHMAIKISTGQLKLMHASLSCISTLETAWRRGHFSRFDEQNLKISDKKAVHAHEGFMQRIKPS